MNNSFIKSTIILVIGGVFTKILGMVIKIIINRLIGIDGMSIYMMIIPTYMLLITICQLGMPISISKLVSEGKSRLVLSLIPILIVFNLVIMIIFIFLSKFIAINLLHNISTYLPLKCMAFTLPFISISSILKGYFFGKEKMIPHVLSNIIEDITKIIILYIGIPIFIKKGIEITVCFIILTNIITEITSIVIYIIFIPNKKISINEFKINKIFLKETLNIGIPSTISRLISNFAYFLEPIIITYFLLKNGYSNYYISSNYAIITGYVMPLLLLPSFFTSAISTALIPVVSKLYFKKDIVNLKKKLNDSIIISLFIGTLSTLVFLLIPQIPLYLVYNTNKGINYIRILSIFFLIYYIESPIVSVLQAIGDAKAVLIGTFIGTIIKLVLLVILSNLHIGLYSLIISTIINILFVTIYYCIKLKNKIKKDLY